MAPIVLNQLWDPANTTWQLGVAILRGVWHLEVGGLFVDDPALARLIALWNRISVPVGYMNLAIVYFENQAYGTETNFGEAK